MKTTIKTITQTTVEARGKTSEIVTERTSSAWKLALSYFIEVASILGYANVTILNNSVLGYVIGVAIVAVGLTISRKLKGKKVTISETKNH